MRKITDWIAIDWRLSNAQVQQLTGAAISTVIKRRTQFGHKSLAKWTRPDTAALNQLPERRRRSKQMQPLATAAAKLSPKSGRGARNVHAVDWHIISPDGEHHKIRNLYQFVRDSPHLFAEADVAWKRTDGKRGTGGEWCNATAGLLNIKSGRAKQWKGWSLFNDKQSI